MSSKPSDRHLARYLAVAQQAGPELERGALEPWLTRLKADIHNLRAAMDWALATGRAEACLSIAAELWLFWLVRGRWREIRRRLEIALSAGRPDREATVASGSALITATTRDGSRSSFPTESAPTLPPAG